MEPFENEITLTAGQWQAKVLPGFGMNLISLRRNESPILREPADEQVLMENPHVYGVPLLLPANRTAGGRFEFEGKMYQIPINEPAFSNHIHGFLYNAPFEVLQQTDDSVTASYENYGNRYPFPFVMTITDTLFEVSENFDQWILFNGGGEQGFLCIEPQCGQVNGLNMPGGHHVLQPGEIETFTFTIEKENANEDYRY